MAIGIELEVVHGAIGLERNQGREVAYVAPDAGYLERRRELLAGARAYRIVDGVVGIGEGSQAGDDAFQCIRALDAGPEADGLEVGLRGGAERGDVGAGQ